MTLPFPRFAARFFAGTFLVLGSLAFLQRSAQALDDVDPDFNPVVRGYASIAAGSWHPLSERLYVSGDFDVVDGQAISRLTRLTADGEADLEYVLGSSIDGPVNLIEQGPSDTLYIAGEFENVGGHGTSRVAKLDSSGALDTTFAVPAGSFDGMQILAIQPLSDGSVIVGVQRPYASSDVALLFKLLPGGGLDGTFTSPLFRPENVNSQPAVKALAVQSDGMILAGGYFSHADGELHRHLVRTDGNGTLDTDYAPQFEKGTYSMPASPIESHHMVQDIAILSDGRLVVGGRFGKVSNLNRYGIVILTSTGAVDTGFFFPPPPPIPPTSTTSMWTPTVTHIGLDSDGLSLQLSGRWLEVGTGYTFCRISLTGAREGTFHLSFINTTVLCELPGDRWLVGRSGRSLSSSFGLRNNLQVVTDTGTILPPLSSVLESRATPQKMVPCRNNGPFICSMYNRSVNGVRGGVLALTSEGEIDPGFSLDLTMATAGSSDAQAAHALELPDGRILVSGIYSECGGLPRKNLALVEAGGSVVPEVTFGDGPSSAFDTMVLLADGRILLAGFPTHYNGVSINGVAILDLSQVDDAGHVHAEFPFSFDSSIDGAAGQDDGKILIVTDGELRRYTEAGVSDGTFNPSAGFNTFEPDAVALDEQQRIYVAGYFRKTSSSSTVGVVRLLATGAVDTAFNCSPLLARGTGVIVQTDGKVLVCGNNQQPQIARLTSTGALDTSFECGVFSSTFEMGMALAAPDSLYVWGRFDTAQDLPRTGVARIQLNQALPPQVKLVPAGSVTTRKEGSVLEVFGYSLGTEETAVWSRGAQTVTNDTGLPFPHVGLGDAGTYELAVTGPGGTTTRSFAPAVTEYNFAEWTDAMGIPADLNASTDDADEDGQDNQFEYLARTNPMDGASRFLPTLAYDPGLGQITVDWTRVPGRQYYVHASPDLETWPETYGPFETGQTLDLPLTGEGEHPLQYYYKVEPVLAPGD